MAYGIKTLVVAPSDSEVWRRTVMLFLQGFVSSPHLDSKAYQDSREGFLAM